MPVIARLINFLNYLLIMSAYTIEPQREWEKRVSSMNETEKAYERTVIANQIVSLELQTRANSFVLESATNRNDLRSVGNMNSFYSVAINVLRERIKDLSASIKGPNYW